MTKCRAGFATGVHTIPQSVTFPSHAVWKPALFCDGKSDGIVQFRTGIV